MKGFYEIVKEEMDFITRFFDEGGILSNNLDGYKKRETQIAASRLVAQHIQEGKNLAIQMPVGGGKTHMYSVPAIKHAIESGKKIVISCPSIMLQNQLVDKDLPFLQKHLQDSYPFRYALIKGRNNYACNKKIEENYDQENYKPGSVTTKEAEEFENLYEWYSKTTQGDFNEIEFTLSSKVKEDNSITDNECTGKGCAFYDACFSQKARAKAFYSDVIVVNYHILLLDLKIKAEGGKGFLPEYNVLIMDEAHQIAEISRGFLGYEITHYSLRRTMDRVIKAWKTCWKTECYPDDLMDAEIPEYDNIFCRMVFDFKFAVEQYCKSIGEYQLKKGFSTIITNEDVDQFPTCEEIFQRIDPIYKIVARLFDDLSMELDEKKEKGDLSSEDKQKIDISTTFSKALDMIDEFKSFLHIVYKEIINNKNWHQSNFVANVCLHQDKVAQLTKIEIIPVDVSKYLKELIWQSSMRSVIATSATLKDGDRFDYFIKSTGFENGNCYSFKSEFDLKSQMQIVIDKRMPDPSTIYKDKKLYDQYMKDLVRKIAYLINEREGGILVLSTSVKQTKELKEMLVDKVDYPILCQYDGLSKTKIINQFREDRHSNLIGSQSLFEGIDVIGESLNCVVICKLPFKHINDPISIILGERGENPFFTYTLPLAVIAFTQGCGRLIRTATDTGVVYIADPRISTKKYGKSFLSFFMENGVNIQSISSS